MSHLFVDDEGRERECEDRECHECFAEEQQHPALQSAERPLVRDLTDEERAKWPRFKREEAQS